MVVYPVLLITCVACCQAGPLDDPASMDAIVVQAFAATHDGFSSDEVILDDRLNQRFLSACREKMPNARTAELNWRLLNLRKAGKLNSIRTTQRRRTETGDVQFVAEIATRSLIDRHQVSIDRIMTDPAIRQEFDARVRDLDPGADPYRVRKAAFQLRKSRRLRPELITRIADWDRQIKSCSIPQFRASYALVPALPGVYIFHDDSGYLYIGQSENVRQRLVEHVTRKGNANLASYLTLTDPDDIRIEVHVFPTESRARDVMVRRAYESELIRSRQPRFNVLP